MLAVATVNNEEKTVYTVPDGKKAYVYVDIFMVVDGNLTVKINNLVYFSKSTPAPIISIKLALISGDTIKVATTGQANVFIHGMEV